MQRGSLRKLVGATHEETLIAEFHGALLSPAAS